MDKLAVLKIGSRRIVKGRRVEEKPSVSCLDLSHVYKILCDMFRLRFNKNLNNR